MTDEIEPLNSALWFRRVEMIARGELRSVENSLRHAAHLLQLAPQRLRHVLRLSIDEAAFEDLLDRGELDLAARHLVAQPTALSLAEEPNGPVQAAISCVILKRVVHGTGDSVATAVLAAWTTCVLALRSEFGADLVKLTNELRREARSERHQQSSLH